MTFSYDFNKADWMAFSEYYLRHSALHRRWRFWSRFGFVPVAILFLLGGFLDPQKDLGWVISFGIVGVVFFFAYPRVYDHQALTRVRKDIENPENAKAIGRQTMTLLPECIRVCGPGAESTVSWDRIVKVVGTEDHLFVHLSAAAAIVIPRLSLQGASFEEVKARFEQQVGETTPAG